MWQQLRETVQKIQQKHLESLIEIYKAEIGFYQTEALHTLLRQQLKQCEDMLRFSKTLASSFEKSSSRTEQEETHQQYPHGVFCTSEKLEGLR